MAEEDLAVAGDPDAAAFLLEELDIERALELADGLGHRRLADMEHVGGLPDAALARDLEEGLQMPELDAFLDHGSEV